MADERDRTSFRERVRVFEREQKRIIPGVFVRVSKGRLQGRGSSASARAWAAACRAAGHPGVLLHDLRRSGVRWLIRSGVPERVALEIRGHKSRAVFDRRAQFGHSQRDSEMIVAR
jgi:integrase